MISTLDDLALREADAQAVMAHVLNGATLDAEIECRVRERSRRATEAVRRKLGTVNVAVDLIREIRDEE